jgi:hypothetical protein
MNRARLRNQKLLSNRDIVSSEQMKKMVRAKIMVTNFHALKLRIRCRHQDHQADRVMNIRADSNQLIDAINEQRSAQIHLIQ